MQTLDLVVVADRWCSTSRTYLTYLHHAGYRVRKVLLVDFVGGGAKLNRLRAVTGSRIASAIIRLKRPLWPDYAPLIRQYCAAVQSGVEHKIDYFAPFNYAAYADSVQSFAAADYDDPVLHSIMLAQPCRTFLYTNGGRVPESLLAQPGVKIFHIHPGVVPYVRGSDGLLWSIAVRGCPGVSCFYMDAGIDTGALIATAEFPLPVLPVSAPASAADEDALYRALLLAYDPHLRASLFRDVIKSCGGRHLDQLPAQAQTHDKRDNYLWMHPKLRQKIMAEVLCEH